MEKNRVINQAELHISEVNQLIFTALETINSKVSL